MTRLVRFRVLDGIAVVTLDSPPVNTLSAPLRAGLWEVFTRIDANPEIKAAILTSSGALFSAGADIRDFDSASQQPTLPQLGDLIEACNKPVVAVATGQALGGGAELMLAAHYRLVTPNARIGLPDVAVGLIPGAGGTQRLTRLIGAERALQMMISASSIDAGSAQRAGLIDAIIEGDVMSDAIIFVQNLVDNGVGPRRARDNRKHLADGRAHQAAVIKARRTLDNTPFHALGRVLECVEVAAMLPWEAALSFEADAFDRCLRHPQSRAMRHVFIAERKIDDALIVREGSAFALVAPMGQATVARLRTVLHAASMFLVAHGASEADIDGAMVTYGFRRGPFGGKDRGYADDDIIRRLVAAIMVEGAICMAQGAVQRASDIDALAVHGLGFPRRAGGPMCAAHAMGLIPLRADMRIWRQENGLWAVPELMDDAIKLSSGFDALDAGREKA